MFRILRVFLGMGTAVSLLVALPLCSTSYAMPLDIQPSMASERIVLAAAKGKKAKSANRSKNDSIQIANTPTAVDPRQLQSSAKPSDPVAPAENQPDDLYSETKGFLEIKVSKDTHMFRLIENVADKRTVLYECKVGLGNRAVFDTPVGMYFVTHIYDENPLWIPPKDRAWAAGQSQSKTVYGGTMAPLLKKRDVRQKRQASLQNEEDKISSEQRLDDNGYRFHGTNAPRSIGRNESHGCVRMLPADAKKVAAIIEKKIGVAERRKAENGDFALLKSTVRLEIVPGALPD
jgi:hypothetical protein